MRPLPVMTALLVAGALYFLVVERDAVLRFAGLDGRAAEATEAAAPAPDAAMTVAALRSRAREVDNAIRLRGETEPLRSVEVRSETSGRVVSTPLRKGSEVTAGQVLCELDAGTRLAELEQARAALAEAEINFRAARALRERGFAPETRAAAAEAAIEAARAAVERAQTEIERLRIAAPFDGVLEDDTAELGALLQPGAPCATVLQLDPLRAVGFVPETQIGRVAHGADALVRFVDGSEARGEVTFVARSADPSTRTFRVDVRLPNPQGRLRAGQTAEIAIAASGATAHLLPGSALTLDDGGTLGVRTVDADGVVGFAPVEMLRDTPDGVLLGGLPERADVIVTGQEYVTEGERVEVRYQEPGT